MPTDSDCPGPACLAGAAVSDLETTRIASSKSISSHQSPPLELGILNQGVACNVARGMAGDSRTSQGGPRSIQLVHRHAPWSKHYPSEMHNVMHSSAWVKVRPCPNLSAWLARHRQGLPELVASTPEPSPPTGVRHVGFSATKGRDRRHIPIQTLWWQKWRQAGAGHAPR